MSHRRTLLIVFGPFRSGTSLTSALLDAMGAEFGPSAAMSPQPDRFNPTGYFQRRDVVALNDTLLALSGHDYFTATPCAAVQGVSGINQQTERANLDWMHDTEIAALKDPRFCFTWPLWELGQFAEGTRIRLIRVKRDLNAIASSAAKHRFVSQYCSTSLDKALEMSRAMDASAEKVCEESLLPSYTVDYDRLIADPGAECRHLAQFAMDASDAASRKASRLIGKSGALRRHYLKKISDPRAVFDAALKTAFPSRR